MCMKSQKVKNPKLEHLSLTMLVVISLQYWYKIFSLKGQSDKTLAHILLTVLLWPQGPQHCHCLSARLYSIFAWPLFVSHP